MIVSRLSGATLAIEPYLATVVLAGGALRHAGNAAQQAALIPKIVDGSMTLALAHQERQSRFDLSDMATTARADGKGGYTLEGEKMVVAARRQRRQADRLGARRRRPARRATASACSWSMPRPTACRGGAIPRRTACAAADVTLSASRSAPTPCSATRTRAAGARARRSTRPSRHWRRSRRRHGGAARDDGRLPQDAQAVRRADRLVPGAAASRRRHVHALEQARSMAFYATMMAGEPDAAERRKAIRRPRCRSAARRASSASRRSSCTAASA